MKGKVSNLAALALTDSWIQVSGDSSYLGTIRTPSKATEGGLVLTDDAAITTLSLWTDTEFGLHIPSDKTLTVGKVAAGTRIPVFITGEPEDGQV